MEKKFRVWDEISKKMYYPEEAKFCLTMIGNVCDDETDTGGILENRSYRMRPLLCVGLKDNSNPPKEIYEGDIVQCISKVKFYREVVYIKGQYWLISEINDNSLQFPIGVVYTSHTDSIVVGNIYENPELLKEKA